MTVSINDPLRLPCGVTLPNRLCKAAMTEGLADPDNRVTERHLRLYETWGGSNVGLSISGNIHVDRRYLERAGNIVVDDNGGLEELSQLARLATAGGNQFWAQINHPGRQSPATVCPQPLAPSAIPVDLKGAEFNTPRAATEADIEDIIERFVHVADVVKSCGFTGVQIHAAHGYLLSSFLSPRANQRTDRWGGSLENRARLLLEICRRTRAVVGADYPVAVKLNSADFQQGGFSHAESLEVLRMLDDASVDLVELSGGNYEDPAVLFGDRDANDRPVRESTRQREAYFLSYASDARQVWPKPLMVTGGFRSRAAMVSALEAGDLDLIGIARPLVGDPTCTARLLEGSIDALPRYENELLPLTPNEMPDADEASLRTANTFGHLGWFYMNIFRLGDGRPPATDVSLAETLQLYPPMEEAVVRQWHSPWSEPA